MPGLTFSIAMCTYNGEMYLREQLASFLKQDRLPDELIVCDDGSRDGTIAILKDFAKIAPFPVRVYLNKENLGYVRNFEKALSLCSGDIIAFSDQDDYWHPDKLERIEAAFKAEPNLAYVVSNAELTDENLNPLGLTQWERIGFSPLRQQEFMQDGALRLLVSGLWFQGACLTFRWDLRNFILPFPPHWDHDNWIPLILSALPDFKANLIQKSLISHRQHTKQLTQRWRRYSFPQRIIKDKLDKMNGIERSIEMWEHYLVGITPLLRSDCEREVIGMINDRLSFHRTRLNMRKNKLHRVPAAMRELQLGRYHKYTDNPWKVLLKDLFL